MERIRHLARTANAAFVAALTLAASAAGAEPNWTDGTPIRSLSSSLDTVAEWRDLPWRRWPGPALWCNRLQDWAVSQGRLVCDAPERQALRTAHLLTYELNDVQVPFHLQVSVGLGRGSERSGFAGFLIGAGEGRLDYRGAALVHHLPGKGGGILAVLSTAEDGSLVFRDMSAETNRADYPLLEGQRAVMAPASTWDGRPVVLALEGVPAGSGNYTIRLSAWHSAQLLAAAELHGVPAGRVRGNVALVSHSAGRNVVHEFEGLRAGGNRLAHHPERAFGPVAGTLYSVSNRTLKLSAQFMHLGNAPTMGGKNGSRSLAHLEMSTAGGDWKLVDGPKAVVGPDYYVPFRVEGWDAGRAAETRVVLRDVDGSVSYYGTRVAKDPTYKPVLSIAGFTGMGVVGRIASMAGPRPESGQVVVGRWAPANVWMPFADATRALRKQDIDLLFFTGDQIYQNKPSSQDPSVDPELDYLYKWFLWHWSFRELTDHLPAIVQPDDHDVYQGNLWGWSGRLNLTGNNNDGGYVCSPYFVNMVHRTQTAHLPDAYDPAPVLNGISNYYTRFTWGGVGFAVLEDRKFKTPGSVTDSTEQILLGGRQERMLREWGEDWRGQKFKCVVSQTIYASMHVGFDARISADKDTGGFPKLRRDAAVRLFRRCGAFVLGGDQHLATFGRLGVDRPSDGVYQFAVPAMGNIFWRWFYPAAPGAGRRPGDPDYTGEFTDGLGNFFRVIAVANPERRSLLAQQLRQRYLIPAEEAASGLGDEVRTSQGDGYGIVRFRKDTRKVTVECWPHDADPPGGKQFTGWPVTLDYEDLDGRRASAWLPDLEITGAPEAVVRIVDQAAGETVKITRVRSGPYSPGVFRADAVYTLEVSDPDSDRKAWTARDLVPSTRRGETRLRVGL